MNSNEMKPFIVLCFTLCLEGSCKGQSTAVLSVASFRAATFVKSSGATPNVRSPSGTKDIPLSIVTTRTLNVGSYTAVSFTSAAMHSVSQLVKTPQVTTVLPSTTETAVVPTFASTVKPTISSSANVDGCNNYTVLNEADRAQGHLVINASNYRCDRDDLVPGWYRFQGAAGDRMADKCVPAYHCGTLYPGWLNGTHPTVSEGVVTRRVCYPRNYYYWYSSSYCCHWSNNIRVRNCGAFFVYELQKPPRCDFRYCGNGSAVDGCNNYTVLSEADRAQGRIVINGNYRCDRYDLVPGWYRFQGAAGDRMADKCVPEDHCGTQYPGWLSGSHPTVSEGVVTRRVCYPYNRYYWYWHWYWHWYWSSSCCVYSNYIRVRNCGAFFVYELLKPPSCDFRYCGNGSAVEGCNNYTVLSKKDRAQGHIVINSNYSPDDYNLVPGWYRFQGAAGDRMADKCVPIDHCGTYHSGWLSGAHPTVEEGVVNRGVCFSELHYCCYWRLDIRMKNCGAYFVYELPRLNYRYWYLYRHARYCGNGSRVDGCNNYTVLSEADRAQGHIVNNASNYRCDRVGLIPGWYRFQGAAGDWMADKCVPEGHCGTSYPVWLSGAHPSVAEGLVTRRVCYHVAWSNSCCYWYNSIRIKNCGAYFVYELPRLYSCPARYCGSGIAAYTCPALTVPSNGIKFGCPEDVIMYNDTVCQFSCNDGYIGSGSQARRCQLNGTWSGQDFACQIINCTSLTQMIDPGGPLRMSSCENHFGAQCDFFCTIGYRLNGSSTVTCVAPGNQLPGVWNNTIPTCEGILCEPPQLAPNLKVNTSCSRLSGDSCEFTCERGYDLIGSSSRTCNSEGSWTGTQPRCEAVKCSELSPPNNGELLGCNTTEMLYNTVCRFSCDEGSEAKGSLVRRCTENGTWSGTDLACIGICGAVEAQETSVSRRTPLRQTRLN